MQGMNTAINLLPIIQYTACGVIMEIGAPAVLTVVEVLRFALEPAVTLLQITGETNVREKLMIDKLATRILVQV